MANTVIQVNNIGKQYRLGVIGTGTLSHDLKRWWYKVRSKEDPFLKVSEINNRERKGNSEYVWALKDVSFEVKRGEVLGIIGKNGAGKSTLLKILSRVTTPTVGEYKVRGRIASLLEVGTGFHPELTGRENIYLNGAILGMTKTEIKSKFDEIVSFSGVERYIDTPVKRYSSGMYVRLAFAVAAHLEPEILIVDEVLAVGDAEFQQKCMGKMQDVAGHGRTILFVSHNMTAIQKLCSKSILLNKGGIEIMDETEKVISHYLTYKTASDVHEINVETVERRNSILGTKCKLVKFSILNIYGLAANFAFGEDIVIITTVTAIEDSKSIQIAIGINTELEDRITSFLSSNPISLIKGESKKFRLIIRGLFLNPGHYKISSSIRVEGARSADFLDNILSFKIDSTRKKELINEDILQFGILSHRNYEWRID